MKLPANRFFIVGILLCLFLGVVFLRPAGHIRSELSPETGSLNTQTAQVVRPELSAPTGADSATQSNVPATIEHGRLLPNSPEIPEITSTEQDVLAKNGAAILAAPPSEDTNFDPLRIPENMRVTPSDEALAVAPLPLPASDEAGKGSLADPSANIAANNSATMPTDVLVTADTDGEGLENSGEEVLKGTVSKGDTASKILEGTGDAVHRYVGAARQVFSMKSFREGQPYVIVTDALTGKVKRFEYEIDNRRRLVVEGSEEPVARVEAIDYVTLLSTVEAVINDNLFQAVADMGESPQMALKLAELFGSEINFIRDLQEGDSFSVLVEKRYRDGVYRGYGRILAAHFTNKGKTFEAYLFRDGQGGANYYNRKGESLRKTLLQAPLAFTRMTSRFTMNRRHPILGVNRPHPGVDYAAPTGTPVKAVGEGMVTGRGWAGGYGNQIILKHGAGLESLYSHLSGYARGLKKGQKVRQGQVIGFVGSTGLSTGPHLDFRLKQNGKFVNPTKAINPRGAPVPVKRTTEFERVVALELAYLKGEKQLAEYSTESIVPENPIVTENIAAEPEKKKSEDTRKRRRKG